MENLSKKALTIIVSSLAIITLAAISFGMYFSIQNTKIDLTENVKAQQQTCEAHFDKMHKQIAQVAQVAEQNMSRSKEAFKEIYTGLIEGRYSSDSDMFMKWVQESNPQFDLNATSKLYEKLANTIKAGRDEYFMEQKKLISYKQEHDKFVQKWPNRVFLSSLDTQPIDIVVITSDFTEDVYKTGKENDINLF
jgi:hypothetical protein